MSNRVTMGQDDSMMLQRDTLPMQVLNKLMDWIMDGKLKMGEKLNTEELARQLGVSRMPIREALKSLEKMGLAESIPYVGVKLVSLEQEDVLQIYLMRQLLEPLAAGEACKKITEEQIHELEEIHKEYVPIVEADEIDAKKLYLQNRKFHFAIYSISEMDRVCAMIESLWDTLSFFKLIYGRDVIKNTNGAKNMIAEHQGYIDALKDRDAERLKKSLYDTLGVRIEGISKRNGLLHIVKGRPAMKINKITNAQEFFKVVDDCKGRVELLTGEGDRLNLKSKLCQFMSMTQLFQSRRTAFGDRCK